MIFTSEESKENPDNNSLSIEPLESLHEEEVSQDISDKEEKRRKGRIRSKRSRDRKKEYFDELENKIKKLEKENFRLQNLLIQYRKENIENFDDDSQAIVKEFNFEKTSAIAKYIDFDQMKMKEDEPGSILEEFWNFSAECLKKHREFLDGAFETIINNLICCGRFNHWDNLDKEYSTSFEMIKKYQRLTKYKIPKFMEKNVFTQFDQTLSGLDLSKKQFELLKNVILKKEFQIKKKLKEALKMVLKGKNIIQKCNADLYAMLVFGARSKVFTDKQFINLKLKTGFNKEDQAFKKIWKIKVEPADYKYDFYEDPLYSRFAKRYFKKDEQYWEVNYNNFIID